MLVLYPIAWSSAFALRLVLRYIQGLLGSNQCIIQRRSSVFPDLVYNGNAIVIELGRPIIPPSRQNQQDDLVPHPVMLEG